MYNIHRSRFDPDHSDPDHSLRTVTAMEEANKIQEKMAKINEAIYGYEHVKNINKSNNRP